jgi:ADP-ribose pyrophosphatase YjhB (NUDIX family)
MGAFSSPENWSLAVNGERVMTVALEMNYCPRCAHPLEDRFLHERFRRVCPSCAFVFFREHKVAAAAIVERHGRILLVRRTMSPGKGEWTIPGGFVEFDEDPREAVVREVLEETGYQVEAVRILDVIFGREHERGASLLIAYLTRLSSDAPVRQIDKKEVDAVDFFSLDQLPPIAFAATQQAISVWRNELGCPRAKRKTRH